jgi:hypothetical protein
MDNREKAFDFALSTTKQVVSLSTGVLALTITFLNDIVSGVGETALFLLTLSWLLFLISVVAGVLTMMSLTGNLSKSEKNDQLSIYEGSIKTFSRVQMTAFLLGISLAVIFGIIGLR